MEHEVTHGIFGGFIDEPEPPGAPEPLGELPEIKQVDEDSLLTQGESLSILQWLDMVGHLFRWYQGFYVERSDGKLFLPFARNITKDTLLKTEDGEDLSIKQVIPHPAGGNYWSAPYNREFGQLIVLEENPSDKTGYLDIPKEVSIKYFLEDPPIRSLEDDTTDRAAGEMLTWVSEGALAISIQRTEPGDIRSRTPFGPNRMIEGMPEDPALDDGEHSVASHLYPMATELSFQACGSSHRFVYGLGGMFRLFIRDVGEVREGIQRTYFVREGPCTRLTRRTRVFGLPLIYHVQHQERKLVVAPKLLQAKLTFLASRYPNSPHAFGTWTET